MTQPTPHPKSTPRLAVTLALSLLAATALFSTSSGQGNGPPMQTICHATGSESNPYVSVTVSAAAVVSGHLGADHQDGEDIVPPFEHRGTTHSQNWDAEGQATWENGCQAEGSNGPPGRHTICHATGSESNPYVVITPSTAGVFNGHLGIGHQGGEDIIPPFEHGNATYSQNWDAEGQAIFDNGCEVPGSSTTTTTEPPSSTTSTTEPPSDTNTTTPPPDTNTTTPPPDTNTTTPPAEIPVFPSWASLAVGVLGALGGAFAVFRRRLP